MSLGIWELLIIAVIVALLFGTKKLRGIGSDFGAALKGFRQAMRDDDGSKADAGTEEGRVIEGEVEAKREKTSPDS